MLVKTAQQYADLLVDLGPKTFITGKSGTGKSLSLHILSHLGLTAGDIDWHGTQVGARSTTNLVDLVEWKGLVNPDGQSARVYCTYEGYGVVIKIWIRDNKFTVASIKFWDLATVDLQKTISYWKTNKPMPVSPELKALIRTNDMMRRSSFAQNFVNPLWIADSAALPKYDYISGTCDNKESVIEAFKPRNLLYNRLEYEMQIAVWKLKGESPYLPVEWKRHFADMASWSRSKADRVYKERLELMRTFGFMYKFDVIPVTLGDFGIPLRNAWSSDPEKGWIKKNVRKGANKR